MPCPGLPGGRWQSIHICWLAWPFFSKQCASVQANPPALLAHAPGDPGDSSLPILQKMQNRKLFLKQFNVLSRASVRRKPRHPWATRACPCCLVFWGWLLDDAPFSAQLGPMPIEVEWIALTSVCPPTSLDPTSYPRKHTRLVMDLPWSQCVQRGTKAGHTIHLFPDATVRRCDDIPSFFPFLFDSCS